MTAALSPALPAPYRARALERDDGAAVHRLIAAVEHDLFGRAETDDDHLAAITARPGFDPRRDGVVVTGESGAVVAWAWVNRRSEAHVHPHHRGRGLGTALLEWIEARARQVGTEVVVQTVPECDTAAVALMTARGYGVKGQAWLLGIDTGTVTALGVDGVEIRAWRPGDETAAHRMTVASFADWEQRPMSFDEWATHTVGRDSFAPQASMVALDGEALVGALIALDVPGRGEGLIESLAVAHSHRGRGIARGLLAHAFGAFAASGHRRCTLWTHTDTGALKLYQRVGMAVERTTTIFGNRLDGVTART